MSNASIDLVAPEDVAAVVCGRHGDPFSVLGMHGGDKRPLSVRAFLPNVSGAAVIDAKSGREAAHLDRLDPQGFFAGMIDGRDAAFPYRLKLRRGDEEWQEEDPYRFPPLLGEVDIHLLAEGRHWKLYEKLGAHPMTLDGVEGVGFAVWAPNAQRVSVVGAFNDWDGRRHVMRRRVENGVWEIFIPGLEKGALYKFEILGAQGQLLPLKSDPLSFAQEAPPQTASRTHGLPEHDWSDDRWMKSRSSRHAVSAPISVYEAHLGSWRRGEDNRFLTYDEIADQLIPYVKDMGFTHVELLPVSEHPFSGSWGYQPIGLFAPTSRFGSPEDFARFIDRFHEAEIGVIIDWVPAHFPTDEHGLARFDGTALYEHEDPRLGFHRDWNTLIYNFGRNEVANFLKANAMFWLDRYHVDALRVDAVASMLYLDYSREAGEWVPNKFGGNENLDAIDFLKETNARALESFPGATTIAEESTAWPQVSRPTELGGLGFGFKWNMGWMNDTLDYMSKDPVYRRYHHHQMTFGIHYTFTENFILPLSHDEVVHGKRSLLGRMPGDRWRRFANLRAYYGFMWTHPGKKLLFMGGEFAQEREWNHDRALDWDHLEDGDHRGVQNLVRDLNRLYKTTPALHQRDCDPEGFSWIDASDVDSSVLCYMRIGDDEEDPAVVVCNFTPAVRENYRVGVPFDGAWKEVLNTDSHYYGGSNTGNGGELNAVGETHHGRPAALDLTLPPLATIVLRRASKTGGER